MAKDLVDLSLDELERRLSSLEEDKQAVRKALEQRRQQSKKDLVQEIRELIQSRNYDVGEIVELLIVKKRGAPTGSRRAEQAYARYEDPANPENVYVRGVLPGWMKEQMQARGLNVKDKADRKVFKEQYLRRVDG